MSADDVTALRAAAEHLRTVPLVVRAMPGQTSGKDISYELANALEAQATQSETCDAAYERLGQTPPPVDMEDHPVEATLIDLAHKIVGGVL